MHLFKVFSLQNWCNFLTNSLSLNKHIFQFLHFSGCSFDELIGVANHIITSFIQKIWQMNEKRKIIRHAIQMHPSDPFYLRATPFSNKFPFLRVAICKWWICILSSLCAFPTYRSSSSYFCSVANYIDFIAKKLATLESSKYGSGSDADVIPDCDARDCPNNHCL